VEIPAKKLPYNLSFLNTLLERCGAAAIDANAVLIPAAGVQLTCSKPARSCAAPEFFKGRMN
jgi:hypothetical protein